MYASRRIGSKRIAGENRATARRRARPEPPLARSPRGRRFRRTRLLAAGRVVVDARCRVPGPVRPDPALRTHARPARRARSPPAVPAAPSRSAEHSDHRVHALACLTAPFLARAHRGGVAASMHAGSSRRRPRGSRSTKSACGSTTRRRPPVGSASRCAGVAVRPARGRRRTRCVRTG